MGRRARGGIQPRSITVRGAGGADAPFHGMAPGRADDEHADGDGVVVPTSDGRDTQPLTPHPNRWKSRPDLPLCRDLREE